ncbi:MAG: hypothetical protein U0800_22475 [Isosphaeraceae bacterium]
MISFAEKPVTAGQDGGLASWMDTATDLAGRAGQGMARGQRWIKEEALVKYPITTLGMAFGLGVLAAWLVKRR